MITCHQLTRCYRSSQGKVRALDGVSLTVAAGEFVCVRGPSGCGKTTLLLTLGGMLCPTSGNVKVVGREVYELSEAERARLRNAEIGFVFQMFHLVPYLSVRDNVLLPSNGAKTAARSRVDRLLDELGLRPRSRHVPAELSAGERQRTAIARALVNAPKLILADEPTGNLDPANAKVVFTHFKEFQRAGGTVVVVTHGATVETYADRVIEMIAGRIQ